MNKLVIVIIAIVVIVAVVTSIIFFTTPLNIPSTTPSTTPKQKPKLRVGTSPDFPPFEYTDEAGNVVGIDIDLIKSIAAKLGYEVEIVQIQFSGLIEALEQGVIDIAISGITITEDRAKRVDFTNPYWEADQAILLAKGSSFKPRSLKDLEGKVVGVQTGTTAASLLDELKANGTNVEIKSYTSYTLAVQDLVNGRVDAVVVDSPVARTLAAKYNVEVASIIPTGEKYGIAVKKGNTELLEKINKVLQEILNGDEWQKIISKYLG